MSHTKEPWHASRVMRDLYRTCGVVDGLPEPVADLVSEANARRIVACVNACAGIPTDELEKRGLVGIGTREGQKAMKQRDELLAALEDALGMVPTGSLSDERLDYLAAHGHQTASMVVKYRALIASVKSSFHTGDKQDGAGGGYERTPDPFQRPDGSRHSGRQEDPDEAAS